MEKYDELEPWDLSVEKIYDVAGQKFGLHTIGNNNYKSENV